MAVGEEVHVVRLVVVRLLQPVGRRRLGVLLLLLLLSDGADVPLPRGLTALGSYSVVS